MTGMNANSDMPLLCSLTIPEQFVLTAARLWVMPYRNAEPSGTEWHDGFAAAGLGEVACMSFEILMRGIAAARRTNFDVRWPCCPRLGGDELCLLNCLSLLQHGATGDAILRLTAWLSPAAMRTVYNPAVRLAELLREAELVLPVRGAFDPVKTDVLENFRHLDRGALLVN